MDESVSTNRGSRRLVARIAAVVLPFLVSGVLATSRDEVTAATGVLVLVLIVVGAAATGDRPAGLLAAVSAGAWFDFFLVPPYNTFTIDNRDDIETAVLLVLISVAVTEVALWGRRQQARASRRSGYLDGVLSAARAVADGTVPAAAVTAHVAGQIADVLDADSATFVAGPVHDSRVAVLDHDGIVSRAGRPIDVQRVGSADRRVHRRPGPERVAGHRPLPPGVRLTRRLPDAASSSASPSCSPTRSPLSDRRPRVFAVLLPSSATPRGDLARAVP